MRFDLYVPGNAFLHRLDPRTKILLMLLLLASAVLFRAIWFQVALLVFLHVVLLRSGVPWAGLRFIWARMMPLTLLILVLQPLFAGADGLVLFKFGPLLITTTGVLDGISLALRANAMAFAASLLLFVTDQQTLVQGLMRLGLPFDYGQTLSLALRYLPTLYGLWVGVSEAQQVRGWTPQQQSFVRRVRSYLPVLVAVVIGSLRLSDELGLALAARGFGAAQTRTVWRQIHFTRRDWFVCGLAVLIFGALLALRVTMNWGVSLW